MASNYTENYGLCQWEATDQVLRTDFNGDNAKLEEALSDLEARVALLDRAVPNLAYNIYDLSMKDYSSTGYHGYRRALLMEDFRTQECVGSLTGGAVVQNGALTLTGAGQTGTLTTIGFGITDVSWTHAIAWMRYKSGGTYSMAVNGVPLTMTSRWIDRTSDGTDCMEMQLEGAAAGDGTAVITLTLATGANSSAAIYDFGVVFL